MKLINKIKVCYKFQFRQNVIGSILNDIHTFVMNRFHEILNGIISFFVLILYLLCIPGAFVHFIISPLMEAIFSNDKEVKLLQEILDYRKGAEMNNENLYMDKFKI